EDGIRVFHVTGVQTCALPISSRKPVDIAINSEASIIIHHDDWYYLLVTHGSCCAGANSSYNIRMGRSGKVTGPYLDNMGIDMIRSEERRVGKECRYRWTTTRS